MLAFQDGLWRVPKGMQEQGEALTLTAMREVLEETGYAAAVFGPLTVLHWTYEYKGFVCNETCHLYVMTEVDVPAVRHDEETQRVAWFDVEEVPGLLHFKEEVDAARELIDVSTGASLFQPWVLAKGTPSATAGSARGRLALTREDATALLKCHERVVILLPQFNPADAHLVAAAAGVVSLVGGPASHIAVVATALDVPCVLAPCDLSYHERIGIAGNARGVPGGCTVEVDGATGEIRALPCGDRDLREESDPAPTVDHATAFAWAASRAQVLGLAKPVNWKVFKRDVVARLCSSPPTRRFSAPWSAVEVAG